MPDAAALPSARSNPAPRAAPRPDPGRLRGPWGAHPRLALALLAGVAVLLRVWHLGTGLPDLLEEAIPLHLALGLRDAATGRIDWNPHHFNYPSLSIYLHFLVQQVVYLAGRALGVHRNYADYLLAFAIDPTPMVLASRALSVACDAGAVLGLVLVGERLEPGAGWIAGALLAFAPTAIVTARSIFCDSVMTVCAVGALERTLAWHLRGRGRDLALAAVLTGAAAGAKYPAAVLLGPLAALVIHRRGARGVALALGAAALAALAFLATTPFALLDRAAFVRDLGFESAHARGGHFGSVQHLSAGFHLRHLAANLGVLGVVLAALGVALALRHVRRDPRAAAVALAALGFAAPIALARIDAERYLLPVIAFAAPLAALAAQAVARRAPAAWRPLAWTLVLAALAGPPAVRGVEAAAGGAGSTQIEARRWCEAHLASDRLLVQEGYSAGLPSRRQVQAMRDQPEYARASPRWRARLDAIPAFHVVAIPLAVSGAVVNPVRLAGRAPRELVVAPHAEALNRMFYDPRLYAGADFFMTSSAIRSRFEADPARFPAEVAFYRTLDARAPLVAHWAPAGEVSGPEIRVYRIGPEFRAASGAARFDPTWWRAAIPADYRARAGALLAGGATASGDSAWIASLAPFYAQRVAPFATAMAGELSALGRPAAAREFARATLAMNPQDLDACLMEVACSEQLADWREARDASARMLAATPEASAEPLLVLLHARALLHSGAGDAAHAELARLLTRIPPGDPLAVAARDAFGPGAPPRGNRRAS